jgi:lambda family phage portal protein
MTHWSDRFAGMISPKWGLRRLRARVAAEMLQRHYEASAAGRRTQGWRRTSSDPNAAMAGALGTLRDVARDLERNNAWCKSGLRTIANHVVGWGVMPDTEGLPRKIRERWQAWANTTACDADGRHNLAGLQKLATRTVARDGEVLVRRRWRTMADVAAGLPIPMQVQLLEPDHLDTLKNGITLPNGGRIIHGVEFDPIGRRAAYWLLPEHPGSSFIGFGTGIVSARIPAENVLHVFPAERAGQVRGPSGLAASILPMKDFDEYEDAALMKQKIAACLAVITSDLDGTAPALGRTDADQPGLDFIEPGMIANIASGRSVTVVEPPSVSEHGPFTQTVLRKIAAGMPGVGYEDLTGDFCVAPEARILRADLRWVRADVLCEGDELIAFDESRPGGQGHRRKWRKAKVVAAGRKQLPQRRIVTDRAIVTVSDAHMFLCVSDPCDDRRKPGISLQSRSEERARGDKTIGCGSQLWVRADRLRPGDRIVFLGAPWDEGRTHTHGYLKGIADGEGFVDHGDAQIGIAQNPGLVHDEIGAALSDLGFTYIDQATTHKVRVHSITGIAACLRFLGEVRPSRLLQKADTIYEGRMMSGGAKKHGAATSATVQAVEAIGIGEVVTLETSTQTFIAEGLCSHNSQVNFSSARMARLRSWDDIEDWRWIMLVPQLCDHLWAWFIQAAAILDEVPTGFIPEWTAPPMAMIEPDKEGLAYQRNIRIGAITWPEMVRERGYNPTRQLREIAEWNKRFDDAKVVLDSDPRKTSQQGQTAVPAPPSSTPQTTNADGAVVNGNGHRGES